jgi:DNA repair exonuclease SbcCD ATPase subunit
MVEAPALDAVRSALAPVEELRGEQSPLETWMRESFATLESLHDELSEWQRELARQQEALDQHVASGQDGAPPSGAVEELQDRLARSQDALRQLEEENAEQLHAIAELDRQLIAAEAELRATRAAVEELSAALEAERQRSLEEQRLWAGELRELRMLLERQGEMLASLGGVADECEDGEPDETSDETCDALSEDSAARTAELRRRAATRRVQRRTA